MDLTHDPYAKNRFILARQRTIREAHLTGRKLERGLPLSWLPLLMCHGRIRSLSSDTSELAQLFLEELDSYLQATDRFKEGYRLHLVRPNVKNQWSGTPEESARVYLHFRQFKSLR